MGSITIDAELLKKADIAEKEVVQVINLNNGQRWETYVRYGPPGAVTLNGGGARLGEIGDELFILSYSILPLSDDEASLFKMKTILVDDKNQIKEIKLE
jgi:aspartate 1-decarboxylase